MNSCCERKREGGRKKKREGEKGEERKKGAEKKEGRRVKDLFCHRCNSCHLFSKLILLRYNPIKCNSCRNASVYPHVCILMYYGPF